MLWHFQPKKNESMQHENSGTPQHPCDAKMLQAVQREGAGGALATVVKKQIILRRITGICQQWLVRGLHGPGRQGLGCTCPLCSAGGVPAVWHTVLIARCGADIPEYLLYLVWECPAYDHNRVQFAPVFEFSLADSVHVCSVC